MSYEEEDLTFQVASLKLRLAELEERVAQLESRSTSASYKAVSGAETNSPGALDPAGLVEAISQLLSQLGEADAGAIRQQLIKSGAVAATIGRSDINKILYAHKDRFEIARQEGVKPLWKVAGAS